MLEFITPHHHRPFRVNPPTSSSQRILKAEWTVPDPPLAAGVPVSRACLDLLSRLLCRDPRARAPLSEIMSHEWITENMPPGAAQVSDSSSRGAHPEGRGAQL